MPKSKDKHCVLSSFTRKTSRRGAPVPRNSVTSFVLSTSLQEQVVAPAWHQHPGSPAPHTPQQAQLQAWGRSSKCHSPKGNPANFNVGFIRRKKGIIAEQEKITSLKGSLRRGTPEGRILSLQSAANSCARSYPSTATTTAQCGALWVVMHS